MNIKELRKLIGYSQQRLADETGIPKSRISQWELGNGNPKVGDHQILTKFFTEKTDEIKSRPDFQSGNSNPSDVGILKYELSMVMLKLEKTNNALIECMDLVSQLRKENDRLKRALAESSKHMEDNTGPEKGRAETA